MEGDDKGCIAGKQDTPLDRCLLGDCREILPTLPPGSVQCCVTSPPYWGLRDYGTATWEGGSEECDHFKLAGGTGAQEAYGRIE